MSLPDPSRPDILSGEWVPAMQRRFEQNVAGNVPLFTVDVADLFSVFIENLPEDEQQHHMCSCCRHFINQFGGLVTVADDGSIQPAFWNINDTPELYRPSARAMIRSIGAVGRIKNVFYSSDRVWGAPTSGGWKHLAIESTPRYIHADPILTANQKRAAKHEDYNTLSRALADFTIDQLKAAVNLLQSEALYRSERFLGPAQWLLNLKEIAVQGRARENLIWRAVATAPAGWCSPRSGTIGALLKDIADGLAYDSIKRRFAALVAPENYQRSQTPPSEGAIKQAEKLFETLGLAPALDRRYARLDEILVALWKPGTAKKAASSSPATPGLFDHLRNTAPADARAVVPNAVTMTWDKFQRQVLPTARSIEVRVPDSANRFAALVTASHADAPPILQWDSEERRNPFSWYYASGIDATMRERLRKAGGQYENVDIRCSLMWHNRNDLDLHCVTPSGRHIYFGSKSDGYGELDVDRNVHGETMEPVENIRWGRGHAPDGRYRFYVCNYNTHGGFPERTSFTIELEINGQVFHGVFETARVVGNDINSTGAIKVVEFNYRREQLPIHMQSTLQAASVSPNAWNVQPGNYVPVNAIVPSPNLWGGNPGHHGEHAFFILEGCRDTQEGIGRGFFNEMVKSELHPVRKVLEAHNAQAAIADAENATACGIGISKEGTDNLIVRVTTDLGVVEYCIDRWD